MSKNDKSGRKKKLISLLASILLIVVASYFGIDLVPYMIDLNQSQQEQSVQTNVDGQLILTMIECGQADSFLLQQGDMTALIDSGTRSTGDDVVAYLKSIGITRLDYVIGTHPHDDHMGGMYDVITQFDVGKVIIPKVTNGQVTANWYLKLMTELARKDSKTKAKLYDVEYPVVGTIYDLGDATMKVVGPINTPESNLNNYSIVLKVTFGQMDILMTGDAEKSVEKDIIASGENIDVEILKVGHHGSDTSSSSAFLDATSPMYALISSEVGNKYEHPVESVMSDLYERNIIVYRTDECGTVVVTITQDSISFDKDPGDYLSGPELEERVGEH